MLLHLVTSALRGRRVAHLAGFPGAGKTYAAASLAAFLAFVCDHQVLWTAESNAPLGSAAEMLSSFLENSSEHLR